MIHEEACCHGWAANFQLPIAAAVFVMLRLSTNQEHWSSTPLIVCPGGVYSWWKTPSQSNNTVNMVWILLWLYCTFFKHGNPGDFCWEDWAFVLPFHASRGHPCILAPIYPLHLQSQRIASFWPYSIVPFPSDKSWESFSTFRDLFD